MTKQAEQDQIAHGARLVRTEIYPMLLGTEIAYAVNVYATTAACKVLRHVPYPPTLVLCYPPTHPLLYSDSLC
eukprot:1253611-Rhodomonas_salina.1